MSKSRQVYGLPAMLRLYCRTRTLDLYRYSEWHFRIIDPEYTVIDIWTTGKYYVKETHYHQQGANIVERGGRKGWIPETYPELQKWLDKLFYAAEMR